LAPNVSSCLRQSISAGGRGVPLGASPLNKDQHKTLSKKACHHCLGQTNPTFWKPPTEEQSASFCANCFALLLGLWKLKAMGIRRDILKTDSQVISVHVDKSSKARDLKLEKYLDAVRRLEASFEGFSVKNVPRGENEHADLLAKSAAQGLPFPSEVFSETIKAPIERAVLTISHVHSEDWRTEIISFLQGNCLSDDEAYNKRMEANTRPYVIIEGELYKHGVCSPLLKCLSRNEGQELMKEIHAELCGAHIGSRPLMGNVFRQGFYCRRQLRM
jgi:ribonuclease HI